MQRLRSWLWIWVFLGRTLLHQAFLFQLEASQQKETARDRLRLHLCEGERGLPDWRIVRMGSGQKAARSFLSSEHQSSVVLSGQGNGEDKEVKELGEQLSEETEGPGLSVLLDSIDARDDNEKETEKDTVGVEGQEEAPRSEWDRSLFTAVQAAARRSYFSTEPRRPWLSRIVGLPTPPPASVERPFWLHPQERGDERVDQWRNLFDHIACVWCGMKFASIEELEVHENESGHKVPGRQSPRARVRALKKMKMYGPLCEHGLLWKECRLSARNAAGQAFASTGGFELVAWSAEVEVFASMGDFAPNARNVEVEAFANMGDSAPNARSVEVQAFASMGDFAPNASSVEVRAFASMAGTAPNARSVEVQAFASMGDSAPLARSVEVQAFASTGDSVPNARSVEVQAFASMGDVAPNARSVEVQAFASMAGTAPNARSVEVEAFASMGDVAPNARSVEVQTFASMAGTAPNARSAKVQVYASTGGFDIVAGSAEERAFAFIGDIAALARSVEDHDFASMAGSDTSAKSAKVQVYASTVGNGISARNVVVVGFAFTHDCARNAESVVAVKYVCMDGDGTFVCRVEERRAFPFSSKSCLFLLSSRYEHRGGGKVKVFGLPKKALHVVHERIEPLVRVLSFNRQGERADVSAEVFCKESSCMEGRKVDDLWHRLSVCPQWASTRERLQAIDSERWAHWLQGLRVNRNSEVEGADP
uniref:C2H2-type domain-containing protein n=1 Tax=Chromera velia CCMP2878 TaxID=1169474 RepID=A0A0G4I3E6_9ALVE|eukprot:Cvel_10594.t1-p1 / transcript=Cvel_10594.t1 / gene=Cvel_10594 / organism=Chromera_velia_CCMP2878 / gene_product=Zinc finger protein 283, putative / transcript_product=Zinc finger protein 283, putative / location=Cvel_scaffold642:49025-61789(+) / protein_length=708 / sequence_SO=supercontig / SO=protein_coding / is_pseudo=false